MAGINMTGLGKIYPDGTRAVGDVNLEIADGEFLVLVGPSGCGKSTVLRMIAGLEEISEGEMYIGDTLVNDVQPKDRDIAMVFQNYALYPHMTVYDNMAFGLKLRKMDMSDIDRRVKEAAEILEITDFLERKPKALSGGQRQRVAMGRAIVREPKAFLMDEPLSNLDAKLRHEMRLEIRALQRKLGISMVYVTHDQAEAMSMADRVVLLRDGRIEQNAFPEVIYQQPATAFVAQFIGTPPMNIIRLEERDGGTVIEGLDGPCLLEVPGDDLSLGVRPEDLQIGEDGGIPAIVRDLEYLGADTIVDCEIGNQSIAVRAHGRIRLEAGARVSLNWHPEGLHFFQSSTGQRRDDLNQGRPVQPMPDAQVLN